MKQLIDLDLYLGTFEDFKKVNIRDWAIIHATQAIHYSLFGWNKATIEPDRNHPNYLYYKKDNMLSLNWVDCEEQLYNCCGTRTFINVLNFIDKWIYSKKIFVHGDYGTSRAPSICLLYLSKRLNTISNASFNEARHDFLKLYPEYSPGDISKFVDNKWNEIL